MTGAKTLGILFSNEGEKALGDLTLHRTPGAIPFGGRYRLVDFVLSGMVHAGIRNVGIVTQSNYYSLMEHLGSGREWDLARKIGGLTVLPPYVRTGADDFRSNLAALSGIMEYIRSGSAEYVLLSECGLISAMDLKAVLAEHAKNGGGITVVYGRRGPGASEGRRLSLSIAEDGRLCDAVPCSGPLTQEEDVYLGTCVMDKALLIRLVTDAAQHGLYSFDRDILQRQAAEGAVRCIRFDGYAEKISGLQSYYSVSMDLLDKAVRDELFSSARPIYTKVRDEVPARFGLHASVNNCLLADGCIIEGRVENSIIFRGVRIGAGSEVKNSIVMQGAVIDANAELDFVVADKDVLIRGGRRISGYRTYPVYIPKGTSI